MFVGLTSTANTHTTLNRVKRLAPPEPTTLDENPYSLVICLDFQHPWNLVWFLVSCSIPHLPNPQ